MQSHGMTLMLREDEEIVERYKDYHRKAWPEVVARLRDAGILEMRIYLFGRRMFMYLEAVDGFAPYSGGRRKPNSASGGLQWKRSSTSAGCEFRLT